MINLYPNRTMTLYPKTLHNSLKTKSILSISFHWFHFVGRTRFGSKNLYKRAEKRVLALKFVNDHAERGVALVQRCNKLLTKCKEQFQFFYRWTVVSDHQKKRTVVWEKSNEWHCDFETRLTILNFFFRLVGHFTTTFCVSNAIFTLQFILCALSSYIW